MFFNTNYVIPESIKTQDNHDKELFNQLESVVFISRTVERMKRLPYLVVDRNDLF